MTLREYIQGKRLTAEEFAATIKVSRFAVGKWVRGERMPRPKIIERIEEATGGEVTAVDLARSKNAA